MESAFVHDIGREMIRVGWFRLTYYEMMLLLQIIAGSASWVWQLRRGGYSRRFAWLTVPLGLAFILAGVRLTHCLLYEPGKYLADPIQILYIFQGGAASHGAAFGLALMFLLLSRIYKLSLLDLFDRFTFNGATGGVLIRIGNFFNSEIVGRETDLPWGVRFTYYDYGLAVRHPTQLYEALLLALTLAALFSADRRFGREERPLGLLFGLSMAIYFTGRFFLEFTKDAETFGLSLLPLNMGQYLSLPFALLGIGLVVWALKTRRPVGRAQAGQRG